MLKKYTGVLFSSALLPRKEFPQRRFPFPGWFDLPRSAANHARPAASDSPPAPRAFAGQPGGLRGGGERGETHRPRTARAALRRRAAGDPRVSPVEKAAQVGLTAFALVLLSARSRLPVAAFAPVAERVGLRPLPMASTPSLVAMGYVVQRGGSPPGWETHPPFPISFPVVWN